MLTDDHCVCLVCGEDGTYKHNQSSGKKIYMYPSKLQHVEAILDGNYRYSWDLHTFPCMNHLNNYLEEGWGERNE
jgi:hypothetical protein